MGGVCHLSNCQENLQVKELRRALLHRNFSATVLRHTTPDEQGHCHPAHVMSTFRSAFSLLLTPLCQRRSRAGAHNKTDSRGTDKYPIQGADRTRLNEKLRLTPVPGRETDTKGKASSGQVDAT